MNWKRVLLGTLYYRPLGNNCTADVVTVFTKVQAFLPWIKNITGLGELGIISITFLLHRKLCMKSFICKRKMFTSTKKLQEHVLYSKVIVALLTLGFHVAVSRAEDIVGTMERFAFFHSRTTLYWYNFY